MGGPGFTGKEHTGVHSGVDAAGNVGVEPVPYHQSLFSGEAGQGETQFHHLGAGFSQVDRFPAGGGGEHAADSAAVRDKTKVNGAAQVRVGGVEGNLGGGEHPAGLHQFAVGELAVVSRYHTVYALLRLFGDVKAAAPEFFRKRGGAQKEDFFV